MTKPIHFYIENEKYGEFSNYFHAPFHYHGKLYQTNEHFFQAKKYMGRAASKTDREYAELIRAATTPALAKKLANKELHDTPKWIRDMADRAHVRRDWEHVKDNLMLKAIRMKFSTNERCKRVLISTGDAKLFEHTKNDTYWADGGDGKGKNMLGRLLEQVRREIH